MRSLPVDWPGIAALAASGVTLEQISRQTGVALPTLKSRCRRGGWKRAVKVARDASVGVAVQAKQMIPAATDAVQVIANTLADDSKETRASLSRAARKMARDAESADLEQAGDVLQVGKLASLTHGWGDGSSPAVRISMYAHACEVQVEVTEVIDVEAEAMRIEDAQPGQ